MPRSPQLDEPRQDKLIPPTIRTAAPPLGWAKRRAVVAAAVGKFPGTTPKEMLAEITRHSRFTAEQFNVLATAQPTDGLHRRIRRMIEDAESFIAKLPSDAVGVVFMDGDKACAAGRDRARQISAVSSVPPSGFWPSSPEIPRAMLERYGKPKP